MMLVKNLFAAAAVAVLAMAGGSAFALEPAGSTNYRVAYAAIAPGGASLSGATFRAPATATGQTLTRLQSAQQLPVSFSYFIAE